MKAYSYYFPMLTISLLLIAQFGSETGQQPPILQLERNLAWCWCIPPPSDIIIGKNVRSWYGFAKLEFWIDLILQWPFWWECSKWRLSSYTEGGTLATTHLILILLKWADIQIILLNEFYVSSFTPLILDIIMVISLFSIWQGIFKPLKNLLLCLFLSRNHRFIT